MSSESWKVLDAFNLREDEKVAVLVDGANAWKSGRHIGAMMDFPKIVQEMDAHCKLRGARYYTAILPDDSAGINGFVTKLAHSGYKVVSKTATETENGWKGNMDIEMAMDLAELTISSDVETFILFTGDGDFIPALEFAQRRGKKIIVVSTMNPSSEAPPDVSTELRKACSHFVDMAAHEMERYHYQR